MCVGGGGGGGGLRVCSLKYKPYRYVPPIGKEFCVNDVFLSRSNLSNDDKQVWVLEAMSENVWKMTVLV